MVTKCFQDPLEQIQLLAKFLEISLNEKSLQKITEETSFDKMKHAANESTNKGIKVFRNFNMRKGVFLRYLITLKDLYLQRLLSHF